MRSQLHRSLARNARRTFSSSATAQARYGFVGLGQMGFQMAQNLHAKLDPAQDSLAVFDINAQSSARLLEEIQAKAKAGGSAPITAATSAAAAAEADYVVTVLPEPAHVTAVYKDILKNTDPSTPTLYADCSTIDPATSRSVAALVQSANPKSAFVDAPMSGGVVGATAGTLTFMLGAGPDQIAEAENLLLKMGKTVLHCGDQGTGLAAKLANNYLLAINNIATAEAMLAGTRLGLDPKVLAQVLNVSTGRCWPSAVNNPVAGALETKVPADRDYAGGFGIALMRKDLRLAMAAAEQAGAHLALAGPAKELYAAADEEADCKGRDFSVVFRYLSRQ